MMTTGKKIKNMREIANLSQIELAEKIGITQSAISHLENGDISPSIATLQKIANSLNCSITELLNENSLIKH